MTARDAYGSPLVAGAAAGIELQALCATPRLFTSRSTVARFAAAVLYPMSCRLLPRAACKVTRAPHVSKTRRERHMRNSSILLTAATTALCACLVGCTKRQPGEKTPSETTTTTGEPSEAAKSAANSLSGGLKGSGYEVKDVGATGELAVTVLFDGDDLPTQSEVPVNTDVDFCNHKVVTENLIVDPASRGVKNLVVRLEGIAAGPKKPPESITVSNRGCAFAPHVGVAVQGMEFAIRNEDPILHTTHPYINNREFFNLPLSPGDPPPRARPLRRPGIMRVDCDVHKWMRGYVVIHSNPYIAVTDAQGRLTIDEIPPGEYKYIAWHEVWHTNAALEEKTGTVKIEAGQKTQLNIKFPSPQ